MVKSLAKLVFLACLPMSAGVEYPGVGVYHNCDSNADIDDMTNGLTVAAWGLPDIANNLSFVAKGSAARGWICGWAMAVPDCHGTRTVTNANDMFRFGAWGANCTVGALQHVALVWTGTIGNPNTRLRSYINGSEVGGYGVSQVGTGAYVADAAAPLTIASEEAGAAIEWDGDIACVAVWDIVLTAEEITTVASGSCRAALKVQVAHLRRLYDMAEGVNGVAAGVLHNLVGDETCAAIGVSTWEPLAVGK